MKFVNIKDKGYKKVNQRCNEKIKYKSIVKGIKNVSANDQGNQNMKETTKIKDIPEDLDKETFEKANRVEDEMNVEDNVRIMCVERNNKGIESIERSGAIMTCKMDVENNLNKDLETTKPKVSDVNEDKNKDANVAKVGENGV
ncbi:37020_t:CDS:2 [Gigaspora margarita]|uniref:37020_t:CDS:1 n=1 Tax=Gigaspora margarita TaxID=4874 RepID=A0ABM8W524_GIGMA|nr:37020_t:CDS:2 [Gigaspora margarita]